MLAVVDAAAAELKQREWVARSQHHRAVMARQREGLLASVRSKRRFRNERALRGANAAARRRLGLRDEAAVMASLRSSGQPTCEPTGDGRISCSTEGPPKAPEHDRIRELVAAALAEAGGSLAADLARRDVQEEA